MAERLVLWTLANGMRAFTTVPLLDSFRRSPSSVYLFFPAAITLTCGDSI